MKIRLLAFAGAILSLLAAPRAFASGSWDSYSPQATSQGTGIYCFGWGYVNGLGDVVANIYVDGNLVGQAAMTDARSDIYGGGNHGWHYTISTSSLAVGSHTVVVWIGSNSQGQWQSFSQSIIQQSGTFTLTAAGSAPVITTQPQSQTVTTGGSASFTVAATGDPAPAFQWRKNGTSISGATGTSFVIASVQSSDAGTYDVVVSNSLGSTTSTGAALAVSAAPSAADLVIANTTYAAGQSRTICATNTITTSGTVSVAAGAVIAFHAATTRVSLQPGFHAEPGSSFHAFVAPDSVAPTVPVGLSASAITGTSFTLTWTAASDSFGVTAYEVQRNSVSLGTFTGLSANIAGLIADTTYSMQVRARDAAGNWSAWSTALSVGTVGDPNGDNDGDGVLNGTEQQLGTLGHTTTADTANSTQLKLHSPQQK